MTTSSAGCPLATAKPNAALSAELDVRMRQLLQAQLEILAKGPAGLAELPSVSQSQAMAPQMQIKGGLPAPAVGHGYKAC